MFRDGMWVYLVRNNNTVSLNCGTSILASKSILLYFYHTRNKCCHARCRNTAALWSALLHGRVQIQSSVSINNDSACCQRCCSALWLLLFLRRFHFIMCPIQSFVESIAFCSDSLLFILRPFYIINGVVDVIIITIDVSLLYWMGYPSPPLNFTKWDPEILRANNRILLLIISCAASILFYPDSVLCWLLSLSMLWLPPVSLPGLASPFGPSESMIRPYNFVFSRSVSHEPCYYFDHNCHDIVYFFSLFSCLIVDCSVLRPTNVFPLWSLMVLIFINVSMGARDRCWLFPAITRTYDSLKINLAPPLGHQAGGTTKPRHRRFRV